MEVYPFFVMEILKSKTNYWKVNIIVAGFSSNIYSRREKNDIHMAQLIKLIIIALAPFH